jgi:hypothetical protein
VNPYLAAVLVSMLVVTVGGQTLAADEPARVALIEDPAETTIVPRLEAELSGLGLVVSRVAKRDEERLPADLVEAARDTGAVAAFRIVVVGDRADVWIADRMTGKVVLREMLPRGASIDGRVVALRAVELLRASLLELDVRRAPAEVAPPPATLPQVSRLLDDGPRYAFAASASVLWSPGGTRPGTGVVAAMAWRRSRWGVRLSGGSTLAPAELTVPEGSGEVTTRWLGLDATLEPRRTRMTWRPRVGVGLAMLAMNVRGVALPAYTAHERTSYTMAPMASVDLGWAVHPRVRMALGLCYFLPLRAVDIVVAGRSVGGYGASVLAAHLGLELVLP